MSERGQERLSASSAHSVRFRARSRPFTVARLMPVFGHAQKALESGVKKVVFDRSGYLYHGRVMALAEAAREAGLQF